jgi:uncharacterized membrane protein YoaK (UPF0700 family)
LNERGFAMNEDKQRDPLVALMLVLTATTGLVDAVSVLGLGRVFTANMTGNVVFLGFAIGGVPDFSLARCLAALLGFLGGAAVGGYLGVTMQDAPRARWLLIVALVEAALLFIAALAAHGYDMQSLSPPGRLYGMIILTGLAMGLRNATVRKLAVPDLTTTVLTLTLTGLAADSTLVGGSNPRWQRRVAAVILMFAGAAVGGVLVYATGLAMPLALGGAIVLLATCAYAMHPAAKAAIGKAR